MATMAIKDTKKEVTINFIWAIYFFYQNGIFHTRAPSLRLHLNKHVLIINVCFRMDGKHVEVFPWTLRLNKSHVVMPLSFFLGHFFKLVCNFQKNIGPQQTELITDNIIFEALIKVITK